MKSHFSLMCIEAERQTANGFNGLRRGTTKNGKKDPKTTHDARDGS
jgi:hypothetical protein